AHATRRLSATSVYNAETGALENLSGFFGFEKCEKAPGAAGMCGICHYRDRISDFWRKLGQSVDKDAGRSGSRDISGINNANIGVPGLDNGKRGPNIFGRHDLVPDAFPNSRIRKELSCINSSR